jgi:hypothetical protein
MRKIFFYISHFVLAGMILASVLPGAPVFAQSSCVDSTDCNPGETCNVNHECAPSVSPEPTSGTITCEDQSGCPSPLICVDHECVDLKTGADNVAKNVYCLKNGICQPKNPTGECPSGWEASPHCPCPDRPDADCIPLENPLQNNEVSIFAILGTILRVALGIIGSLTLLMFVWGGFQWLTSAGNPERVKKGTDTMLWAAIGVFCVFASYFVLSNFVAYLTNQQ